MKNVNRLFIIPAFIGIIGGFSALFVRYVIDFSLFSSQLLDYFGKKSEIYLVVIPIMFVVSSIIIRRFLSDATNPTIDSVAKSIVLKKGRLDYKKGILSVILTATNIGFGVPVGREGPIAKFGGSLTSLFLNALKIKGSDIPLFVTCGVSSSLAATFNAPIAAVVFGFEIILGRLNFNVIIPLSVASSVATIISRYFLGNYPTFYVHKLSYSYLFLLFIPLFALAFSSIVVFFNTTYRMVKHIYRKCACTFYIRALIGGVLVGVLMYLFPDAASLGYAQVSKLFIHHYGFEHAFAISVVKILSLAVTFASGMFGGIFAPSIFVGAFLGFAMGGFMSNFMVVDPLSLALIGTASVTAGISNAPFRSSLIVIELTQNYQMAIPILLSSVATIYFVHIFEEKAHFARAVMQKGFDIADESYRNKLKRLSIVNFIETDIPVLDKNSKIGDIMFELMNSLSSYFCVVEGGKLIGVLSFRDIRVMHNKKDYLNTTVNDLMTHNPNALFLNSNGIDVFEFMSKIEANYIPVVDNEKNMKYMGMLNVGSFSKFVSFVYLRKDK